MEIAYTEAELLLREVIRHRWPILVRADDKEFNFVSSNSPILFTILLSNKKLRGRDATQSMIINYKYESQKQFILLL